MREIKLFDSVALLEDLPEENLWRGQVGAVVEIYNDGEAFEVEFVDTDGQTYGLLALRPKQIMVLRRESIEKIAA
ncbi:DUF4926 domain-containing protein [soil metagenome]